MDFPEFFRTATGHAPYDYQCRLACGERPPGEPDAHAQWLTRGAPCESRLINIPTGLGKTAAVVLAWLWNRAQVREPKSEVRSGPWPRRLVYCLPMRTLVEQTRDNVFEWLTRLAYAAAPEDEVVANARTRLSDHAQARLKRDESELREHTGELAAARADLLWLVQHSPVILMGGEDADREWDIWPEKSAILIGTQDMLLSRSLNRGYGMSRYRWPMHFGLLNNDCLWVMDETQLMGVGVETSAQLDGFRRDGRMATLGPRPTWWMSATLEESRLATVDHPAAGWPVLTLSDAERASGRPKELLTAKKGLSRASCALNATTKAGYAKELATLIKERHQPGTLTLVVVNRVSRAREVFETLTAAGKQGKLPPLYAPERIALIHSRFRPVDRQQHTRLLFGDEDGKGDRIVIATQAVEAGVDVSARLLITELAPWSSLVQRIGRCNRRADIPDAEMLWVDIEPDPKGELLRPYGEDELRKARTVLEPLTDASPHTLVEVKVEPEKLIRPVIRRRDLVDLFDTTPDLCGQDLDISRYIRDGEDNDVQFYWREVGDAGPSPDEKPPLRLELCRVSIADALGFLKKKDICVWRWNPLEKRWEAAGKPRPGGVYLVPVSSGGYDDALGWTREPKDKPTPHPPTTGNNETYDDEPDTLTREWQTIAAHTAQVVAETAHLCAALSLGATDAATLRLAAFWHDVGKAHPDFQKMLRDGPHPPADAAALYAKSQNPPAPPRHAKDYRSLRHELASALAWLLASPPAMPERDLVAYLIAAHHGKVRLSIRSLPNEPAPDGDRLFARGVWDGDTLPAVPLGEITTPPVTLDLGFMQMGEAPDRGSSWLARTVALRDQLGPFRLACLETLLRAADARASRGASDDPRQPACASGVSSDMELRETSTAHDNRPALSAAEQSLVADLVADGLSIQDKFRPEPLYKETGKGHYASDTVQEIRRAKEAQPKGDKS